jgi:hypothetical protein
MDQAKQNELNALQILAKAGEFYVNTLDDLAKNFVGPQVNAAVQIFNQILTERHGVQPAPVDAPPAPVAPAASNDE